MSDIPTDAAKFKQWADAACVSWPEELTAKSYRAQKAMEGHGAFPPVCIDEFARAYAEFRNRE